MCGEKAWYTGYRFRRGGSPPRVRGKALFSLHLLLHLWITPACAGKSWRHSTIDTPDMDHPRVCGEKNAARIFQNTVGGSPPRVRGKVIYRTLSKICHRITPACAGKSREGIFSGCRFKDHPRVCGEKLGPVDTVVASSGSPPRVRGKETLFLYILPLGRITPACAGKRNQDLQL